MTENTWSRIGYQVVSEKIDGDLMEFNVVLNDGEVVGTITPADTNEMDAIIQDLDLGIDVNGWDDGMGNTILIP